jgi:predicted GNAT family acetyltransferase
MIRRLQEIDRASLMALLSAAPQLNLFLLGNLESNGFDTDFCEFFGDVYDDGENGKNGRVRAVVNRYMSGWTVYGEADADWAGLGKIVDMHDLKTIRLQDNPGGIASFLPFLQRYTADSIVEEELMALPESGLKPQSAHAGFVVRKATMDDLAGLTTLYADAGSMSRVPLAVERPLRNFRVWLALKNERIVAVALTNAETKRLAMVGGVFTVPAWRGNGLSQAVCSSLCAELIETGRQPILYWQNPTAGYVYSKLGFRPIGTWRAVKMTQR